MNKQTKLQEVENKVRELCPELMELSFGCEVHRPSSKDSAVFIYEKEVEDDTKQDSVFIFSNKKGVELINAWWLIKDHIIGHPITLESVLKATGLSGMYLTTGTDGRIILEYDGNNEEFIEMNVDIYWILGKSLSQQKEETIEFLHNILINK